MVKQFSLVAILCSIFLSGCVSSGNKSVATLTEQQLSEQLIKGHTTKQQVKNLYGDPKDIETMGDKERWLYEFTKKTPKASGFVPVVGLFMSGTNDETKTLKVYFDDKGYVSRHLFSSKTSETKLGM